MRAVAAPADVAAALGAPSAFAATIVLDLCARGTRLEGTRGCELMGGYVRVWSPSICDAWGDCGYFFTRHCIIKMHRKLVLLPCVCNHESDASSVCSSFLNAAAAPRRQSNGVVQPTPARRTRAFTSDSQSSTGGEAAPT